MSSISVIVPCYRYARFLPACVESVLAQPGVDVRVLILDDASPDDTPAVAAALAARDGRVEYRRHAANQGHIATFNEGLAWADGDYTLLISADDLLAPGALGRAARLLEAHPEAGFVYGRVVTFTSGPPPDARGPAGLERWQIIPGRDWFKAACRRAHITIWSPEVVVRTALQRQVGGYQPDLPQSADLANWLRCSLRADVGQILEADQAYYRLHPNNLHKTLAPTALAQLRHRLAAFEAVFQDPAEQPAASTELKRAVARRLAREAMVAAAGTGSAEAAALTGFAFNIYPPAALTPEYFGLQLGRWFGPRVRPLLRFIGRRFFPL